MKVLERLLIGLLLIICHQTMAKQIEICSDCPASDLTAAITAANPHDTLVVRKGIYPIFNCTIDKPLTILGQGLPILDGQQVGYILTILSDSVHIKGLHFKNSGRSFTKDYASIYAHRIDYFSIEDNIIEDPFFGLLIEKSHHGLIKGNTIKSNAVLENDSGNGIHLWHCSNVTIEENETYGLRDGIYFEFVSESHVTNNYSHDNVRYGLHFMFSNHNSYIGNHFENNGAGVAVMFSKFIIMKHNTFKKNWGTASYGLLLKEIYDGEVTDNTFEENTIAIFLEGTGRMNYLNNDFIQNGWAVKVSGGCYTNIFTNNNFISNAFDVYYNSKMNDNSFQSNYWSEYNGYDLDKDGKGDVPYRPVKLFSYIVSQTPESIILMRSLFVDIINFSEKVSPIFTPDNLVDDSPFMQQIP